MSSWGIADADQLAALTKLLDEYAKEVGIAGDDARDRLAASIMGLFNEGLSKPEEIRLCLDSNRSRQSAPLTVTRRAGRDRGVKPGSSAKLILRHPLAARE
jgi:hypothetical protein